MVRRERANTGPRPASRRAYCAAIARGVTKC